MQHNKNKLNFPAFPFPGFVGADHIPAQPSNSGMSFRDFVAVKAMESLLLHDPEDAPSELARQSFELADAMLEARDKK